MCEGVSIKCSLLVLQTDSVKAYRLFFPLTERKVFQCDKTAWVLLIKNS